MPLQPDQVEQIFNQAIATKNPQQRAAYLSEACANHPELRARIEALLAAHTPGAEHLPLPDHDQTVDANAALTERPGATIGRYKLLQQIGEGGFGTVFMAEQEHPVRRRVALKIIKLGMDTRQVVARFEAERQALAVMDHAGIAKVFDAGATATGRPYFVMELVKGEPITTYCDKNNLSVALRLELFIQVCSAVQHAHQKGLIHRDIKPSNILVSIQDDRPLAKVIDFGIAKATQSHLTEKTLFTEFRQLIGTPEYMSPEQAEGSLDIDTRSDIYSLGVLLYELLTGSTPFDARELRSKAYAEIQRIIREVDPPNPSTRLSTMKETLGSVAAHRAIEPRKLNALIAGELDWIVMKALEKNRARRYESPAALAADITHHLASEPISAGAPSRLHRLRKFVKRNRGPVIASAAVLLVLIAGIIGTTLGLLGEKAQRTIAETEKATAQHERTEAQKQAAEAKEQALIAQAVVNSLTHMLSAVDPARMLGDKVTVAQMMEIAIESLDEGTLSDRPRVEAYLRMTIGNTLCSLGRYKDAEPQFQKALQLRRAVLPANHPEIAWTLNDLASCVLRLGNRAEAEKLFQEALVIRRAANPPALYETSVVLNNLGVLLREQRRYTEAEGFLRESLDLRRKAPAGDIDIATAANNLGTLLFTNLNRPDEAEPLLKEALGILRKTVPPGHPNLAAPLNNLGVLESGRGDQVAAERYLREALAIVRNVLPKGHPTIGEDLGNLAAVLKEQYKLNDAEPLYREALQISEHTYPPGHPNIANDLECLARFLQAKGEQWDEAESAFSRAAEMFKTAGNPLRAELSSRDLGSLLLSRGRFDEAEQILLSALKNLKTLLPPKSPEITESLIQLASLRLDQGKIDDAEELLKQALALSQAAGKPERTRLARALGFQAYAKQLRRQFPEAESLNRQRLQILLSLPHTPKADIAYCKIALASILRESGQPAKAKPLLNEALDSLREILPENHPNFAPALSNYAAILLDQGNAEDALPVARQVLLMQENSADETHWKIGRAAEFVGRCLTAQKEFPQAEEYLIRAEKILRRSEGIALGHHNKCLQSLVDLYTKWNTAQPGQGHDQKATEWQARIP